MFYFELYNRIFTLWKKVKMKFSIVILLMLFSASTVVSQVELDLNVELGRSSISYGFSDNAYKVEDNEPGYISRFMVYNLGITKPISQNVYLRSEIGSIITSASSEVKVYKGTEVEFVNSLKQYEHRYISVMPQYRYAIGRINLGVHAGPLLSSYAPSKRFVGLTPGIKAGLSLMMGTSHIRGRLGLGYIYMIGVTSDSAVFDKFPQHNFSHLGASLGITYSI